MPKLGFQANNDRSNSIHASLDLAFAAIWMIAAASGCGHDSAATSTGESISLLPTDTLITTVSEVIGGVYDLALSENGDLYLADYGYKHILVVAPDGTIRRTIGKEGSGPGEFQMPYVVSAAADSVRVLDSETGQVQVFDAEGSLVRGFRPDVPSLGGGRDFRSDGLLAAAVDGFQGAMIHVADPQGNLIHTFGEPIVPHTDFYDFAAIKGEIRDGRIPAAFRNQAAIVWGQGDSLYLIFQAEPQVRRYGADGELLWTRPLEDAVVRSATASFIRKNIEESNPSRIHSLRLVTDAAVVGSELWLLLNTADEGDGVLLVLSADDGAVLRRITFPGLPTTGHFAVDQPRRRLYMAPSGEASVLILALPN
jgi:hypothetical protein